MKNKSLPIALRITFVGITLIIASEICVRIFSPDGYFTPATLAKNTFNSVPAVFAQSILPQLAQTVKVSEGLFVNINSKGYRGPEFEFKKPAGTTRVIIYGESAVFDITATEGKDWPRQVEQELHQRGFPNIEVINAGTLGHASFDSFGRFFAEGHLLKPDYVMLYNGWNDMKFFGSDEPLLRKLKPRSEPFLYQYAGKLDQWLCELSQIYVRVRYRFIMEQFGIGAEGAKPKTHTARIAASAVEQYRLTLQMFADLARNIGAVPILTLQARLIKPVNSLEEKSKINYESQTLTPEALIKASEIVEQTTREVAAQKQTPLLDATVLSGDLRYLKDHIHPSPEGAKKLAEMTADLLEKLLREKQS